MQSYSKLAPVLCAAVFFALLAGIAPADAQLNCVGTAGSTNISINNCTIPPANLGVTGNVAIGSSFVTATPPTNGMIIQGALGIGTIAPSNLLDVSGGVAIGTQYVGVTAAPASGLLVQGNVGIGTTSPNAPLVISGNMATGVADPTYKGLVRIMSDASENSSGGLEFESSQYLSGFGYRLFAADDASGSNNLPLLFQGRQNSASWSDFMAITKVGNVGIGTTSPQTTLDVRGAFQTLSNQSGTLPTINTSVSALGGTYIGWNGMTGTPAESDFINLYRNATYNNSGGFAFFNMLNTTTVNPTPLMYINSSGNVGIGTTSPYVSLDLHSKTDALALPVGTTGQEPSTPLNGMIRYNSTIPDIEAYIGNAWTTLTTGGDSSNYLGTSRLMPNLSASASDTQTGFYTAGTGKVDVTSQGSQVVEISTSGMNVVTGNVGIGTTSLAQNLQVQVTNDVGGIAASGSVNNVGYILQNTTTGGIRWNMMSTGGGSGWGQGLFAIARESGGTPPYFVINAAGLVGIGTTNPYVSLDLHSKTDALSLPVGTTGQEPTSPLNGMIRYNSTIPDIEAYIGNAWTTLTTGGDSSNYLGTSRLTPNLSASSSDTQTGLYTAGTGKVDVTSQGSQVVEISTSGMNVVTGNVGIGTTSPATTLSVNGIITVQGSGTGYGQLGGNGVGNGTALSLNGALSANNYALYETLGSQDLYINRPSGAAMHFREGNGANDEMTILAGGNVGIGTTTPASTLSVYGGGLAVGSYAASTTIGTGSIIASGNVGIGTTSPSNKLDVSGAQAIGASYVGSVTAPSNGLAVQGKVGIGTSSPQATLDVNGYTKLALNNAAPVACSAATDGSIALTHTRNTCICVGNLSAWTNMVLGNACVW